MNAREIVATMYYGIRVAIRAWIALRQGKRLANNGIRVFRRTLHSQGLPLEVVENLTNAYEANLELLSIKQMSRFAMQSVKQSTSL
ncbi:MAG: hypothetical protein ACFFCH_06020 [Promethearchaeota archaeon]